MILTVFYSFNYFSEGFVKGFTISDITIILSWISPFPASSLFFLPLKITEPPVLKFLRGHRKRVAVWNGRSTYWRCSVKKGVLKNFAKFTQRNPVPESFFNKVADLRPATLLKKKLWHRCFPVILQNV